MATSTTLTAQLEELKEQQAKLAAAQRELIENAVPEIVQSILDQIEILNRYNSGDKYSLKRGIYNVDESRIRPKEKPGTAMGQVGL